MCFPGANGISMVHRVAVSWYRDVGDSRLFHEPKTCTYRHESEHERQHCEAVSRTSNRYSSTYRHGILDEVRKGHRHSWRVGSTLDLRPSFVCLFGSQHRIPRATQRAPKETLVVDERTIVYSVIYVHESRQPPDWNKQTYSAAAAMYIPRTTIRALPLRSIPLSRRAASRPCIRC